MNLRMLDPVQDVDLLPQLSQMAVEAADDGVPVHFADCISDNDPENYWREISQGMAGGKLAVLGALEGGKLLGSLSLCLNTPPNQAHCTRLRSMLVRSAMQRRGIGSALLAVAEAEARNRERWLMLAETVSGSPAAKLFTRAGWEKVGDVPAMVTLPHGGLAPGTIYFKRL